VRNANDSNEKVETNLNSLSLKKPFPKQNLACNAQRLVPLNGKVSRDSSRSSLKKLEIC